MLNTFYDCYLILTKVYKDKAFFKQALNTTSIEEKNRAKTTKICYGVLDRDEELSFYISSFPYFLFAHTSLPQTFSILIIA
jgi:hypothetical protein